MKPWDAVLAVVCALAALGYAVSGQWATAGWAFNAALLWLTLGIADGR